MTDNWVIESQAFILVYSIDNKESFNKLDVRREIIIKQGKETSPIILVGNKFDKLDSRIVSFEEGFAKAKLWDAFYIETSTIVCIFKNRII
jgi:GTPase SAR1 family protein